MEKSRLLPNAPTNVAEIGPKSENPPHDGSCKGPWARTNRNPLTEMASQIWAGVTFPLVRAMQVPVVLVASKGGCGGGGSKSIYAAGEQKASTASRP